MSRTLPKSPKLPRPFSHLQNNPFDKTEVKKLPQNLFDMDESFSSQKHWNKILDQTRQGEIVHKDILGIRPILPLKSDLSELSENFSMSRSGEFVNKSTKSSNSERISEEIIIDELGREVKKISIRKIEKSNKQQVPLGPEKESIIKKSSIEPISNEDSVAYVTAYPET